MKLGNKKKYSASHTSNQKPVRLFHSEVTMYFNTLLEGTGPTAGYVGLVVVQKSEMLGTTMCDTFLESGRSQKLNGTMESPPKNLESWNPGILESWNGTN